MKNKKIYLTDDYFAYEEIGSSNNTKIFAYRKYENIRFFVRKFMNVAVSDLPISFFESDKEISIGKKITLLESVEINDFEIVFKSRFNTTFSQILNEDSLLYKMYLHLLRLIPNDKSEDVKLKGVMSEWGRPDYSVLAKIPISYNEKHNIKEAVNAKGELYSIVLKRENSVYIIKTDDGFVQSNLSPEDNKKFKDCLFSFLNNFKDNFSEMQYKRLLFLGNKCKRCGQCCKVYEVEADPFEQERIAEHLNITTEEFLKKYTHEDLFSWNSFSSMLNKQNGINTPCIFQGICEDGLYGCTIHTVRPEVCRKFLPSLGKCIMNGVLPKVESILDNLVSFTLTSESVMIDTELTNDNKVNPVILDLDNENIACRELIDFFLYFKEKVKGSYTFDNS